jgi:hypothetical protein
MAKSICGLFAVLCGYHHKKQRGLELEFIIPIENGEEPKSGQIEYDNNLG